MARHEEARGMRDEMNVGPEPQSAVNLKRLRELEHYEVAGGEPDIRGWTVFSSTGREMGKVHDLLVDTDAGEVVMLDVDLRRDGRHTLAPIRSAWVDRETKRVVVDAATLERREHGGGTAMARDPDAAVAAAAADAALVSDATLADARRTVRYPRDGEEVVIDRRPVVEEVVVRRRPVEEGATDSLLDRGTDDPIQPA